MKTNEFFSKRCFFISSFNKNFHFDRGRFLDTQHYIFTWNAEQRDISDVDFIIYQSLLGIFFHLSWIRNGRKKFLVYPIDKNNIASNTF